MTGVATLRASMVKKTRRDHGCFDCAHIIRAGSRCWSETLLYDYVYTLWYHPDCRRASAWYLRHVSPVYGYEDGVPPLAEMVWDNDGQIDLDRLRGRFPHVVTRIEFWQQLAGRS